MTTTINKASVDTWVAQSVPTKNFDSSTTLQVGLAAGDIRYSYILLGLPFSRGSLTNVHSGKLRLWNVLAFTGGAVTVRLRLITSPWTRNLMTYNGTGTRGRPTVGGTTVDVTKTNAAAGTLWEFDVTAQLGFIANGTAWYGWRIEVLSGANKAFYGSLGSTNLRPQLEVEYSDAPNEPSLLVPGQGKASSLQYPVFQTDFVDHSGSTQQAGMRIQISATHDGVTPTFDSGMVATTIPEIHTDPADPLRPVGMPAWAGIASAATSGWRAKVMDSANVESDWSDWQDWSRITKGTLAIVSPAATVSDASFTVAWTFTVRNQTAYNVIIRDSLGVVVYQSNKITSFNAFHALPDTVKLKDNGAYSCEVQIWDDQNRIAAANDPAYVSAKVNFTFVYSATVTPFNNLTASGNWSGTPWTVLFFDRAAIPDKINIFRDGVLIWTGVAGQLFLPGPNNFGFLDYMASAHESHTWYVQAVVNNVGSASNPTVTFKPYIKAPWVGESGFGGLYILNPETELFQDNGEELVQFVGNYSSAVVQTGNHGATGTIKGHISLSGNDEAWPTEADIRFMVDYLFGNPGLKREIHIVNQVFHGYVHNVKCTPRKDISGVYYEISFDFGEDL